MKKRIQILFLFVATTVFVVPVFAETQTDQQQNLQQQAYDQQAQPQNYQQQGYEQQQQQTQNTEPAAQTENQQAQNADGQQDPNRLPTQEDYEKQWEAYEKQQTEAWRKFYRLPNPPVKSSDRFQGASPALTATIPAGFGASWGEVFGASYLYATRYTAGFDGAVSAGLGLGDPSSLIGASLLATLYDLDGFSAGSFSFKLHRLITPTLSVAAGMENAVGFGSFDSPRSIYVAATKYWELKKESNKPFSVATFTFGLGTGRFLPEGTFISSPNNLSGINFFAGGSMRLFGPLNLIANYNGQNIDIGLSYGLTIFKKANLVITPMMLDMLGLTTGANNRIAISFGLSYSFNDGPSEHLIPTAASTNN